MAQCIKNEHDESKLMCLCHVILLVALIELYGLVALVVFYLCQVRDARLYPS
jgi:hypothetical protein